MIALNVCFLEELFSWYSQCIKQHISQYKDPRGQFYSEVDRSKLRRLNGDFSYFTFMYANLASSENSLGKNKNSHNETIIAVE